MVDAEDSELVGAVVGTNDELLPTGRIVGVLRRNWRPYCGILHVSHVPSARRHLFAAHDRRVPRIRIETRQADLLKGEQNSRGDRK